MGEMAMNRVRWLLVGAGDIARKRVAAALSGASGSQLLGVCDPRAEAAGEVAARHGATEVFGDLDTALESSAATAAYVATPVWLHVDHARRALEAGKSVLVEKPLGLSAAGCHPLLEAARSAAGAAGCSYYRRLYPAYDHARRLIERGDLGRIVLVRMCYYSWFDPGPDDPKRWRVEREKSGGGPLSDMGTHMFDLLIGLLGMPRRVYARCDNLVHDWEVEDTASITMTTLDGAHVNASFGWCSRTWRHEMEIIGTEAKLCWQPYDSGTVMHTTGREITELRLEPAENVHQPLVQDFVDAMVEGRAPACPLEEAHKTNVLLDAVYESARANREIEIAP